MQWIKYLLIWLRVIDFDAICIVVLDYIKPVNIQIIDLHKFKGATALGRRAL